MSIFRKAIRNWRPMIMVLLMAASVPASAAPDQLRGPDGARYWNYEGQWYRWGGGRWIGTRAPIGLLVPSLPFYASMISWNGTPYYYADETYYVWNAAKRQFQVAAPPSGINSGGAAVQPRGAAAQPPMPPIEERLFVYPKNGQTPEQQKKDRDECARWAVDQSGFNPAVPGAPVTAAQAAQMRGGYFLSQASCLEGRGYSVK